MKLIACAFSFAALTFLSCGGNKAEGRWQPYSGCGETQCRSWNLGCEADCLNQGSRKNKVDADVCMTQCREKMNVCMQSCNAPPA